MHGVCRREERLKQQKWMLEQKDNKEHEEPNLKIRARSNAQMV